MKLRCFWLSVNALLFSITGSLSAQTFHEYKKELKELKGSSYVQRAYEAANDLADRGHHKSSVDMLELAVKKSKPLGSGAYTVVLINCAEVIAEKIPKTKSNVQRLIHYIKTARKYDLPSNLLTKSQAVLVKLRSNVSTDDEVEISKMINQISESIALEEERLKNDQKQLVIKEFEEKDIEEVYDEMQSLKQERKRLESERLRLENIQSQLSSSIEENKQTLKSRSRVINRMSREQAKKEAILQYNQRMIDSLKFMAELDSINLENRENKINRQEAQLALQQSEIKLKDSELSLKSSQQRTYYLLSILGLLTAGFLTWVGYLQRRSNQALKRKNVQIEEEKQRSEDLLLNILPKFIAQELKENSKVKTRLIPDSTVLFTDFINFSNIAKTLSPQELIEALDECFREFDNIISKYNIEKIKTIGDAYMCASGVPVQNNDHAIDSVNAAVEMVEFLDTWNLHREKDNKIRFDARIGIHSGPIIAGVVGAKKFAYDIWGDTVNVAARIEEQSSAQKINISSSTYTLIKDHYQCVKRGSLSVKNMSDLEMYYIDQRMPKSQMN